MGDKVGGGIKLVGDKVGRGIKWVGVRWEGVGVGREG